MRALWLTQSNYDRQLSRWQFRVHTGSTLTLTSWVLKPLHPVTILSLSLLVLCSIIIQSTLVFYLRLLLVIAHSITCIFITRCYIVHARIGSPNKNKEKSCIIRQNSNRQKRNEYYASIPNTHKVQSNLALVKRKAQLVKQREERAAAVALYHFKFQ